MTALQPPPNLPPSPLFKQGAWADLLENLAIALLVDRVVAVLGHRDDTLNGAELLHDVGDAGRPGSGPGRESLDHYLVVRD